MQPALTDSFTQSPEWQRLSAAAQGVLRGVLVLAIHRDGEWGVDGSARDMSDWFGRELGMAPGVILAGLRELEGAGYLRKGRRGMVNRFIVGAPLIER